VKGCVPVCCATARSPLTKNSARSRSRTATPPPPRPCVPTHHTLPRWARCLGAVHRAQALVVGRVYTRRHERLAGGAVVDAGLGADRAVGRHRAVELRVRVCARECACRAAERAALLISTHARGGLSGRSVHVAAA
jgi:hypothetical protein